MVKQKAEIREEVENIRKTMKKEWSFEPKILRNITIKLRYGDASWDYETLYLDKESLQLL